MDRQSIPTLRHNKNESLRGRSSLQMGRQENHRMSSSVNCFTPPVSLRVVSIRYLHQIVFNVDRNHEIRIRENKHANKSCVGRSENPWQNNTDDLTARDWKAWKKNFAHDDQQNKGFDSEWQTTSWFDPIQPLAHWRQIHLKIIVKLIRWFRD
jgi:hypothetical protein